MLVAERGVIDARDDLSSLLSAAERGSWSFVRDRSGHRCVVAEWPRLWELAGQRASAPKAWLPMSEARASFPALYRTGQTEPVGITRRGHEFLLTDSDVVAHWLRRFRFTTEVIYEPDGGVALWVPELAIFGRGASYADARADLLAEVLDYLADWEDDLQSAPNHRAREGWVRRLQLVADEDALAAALLEG